MIAGAMLSCSGGLDRDQRIRCAISREMLDDHFGGDHRSKLEVSRGNDGWRGESRSFQLWI